jgi:hypothetical protein
MSGYDFFNDAFPENDRVPYKLIRWWFLGGAYRYCQHAYQDNYAWIRPWADEYVASYEQYESAFNLPIENLMLEVLVLVMVAGRDSGYEKFEQHHREKISAILEKDDLIEMLKTLSGEELNEFEHDLKLLNLL